MLDRGVIFYSSVRSCKSPELKSVLAVLLGFRGVSDMRVWSCWNRYYASTVDDDPTASCPSCGNVMNSTVTHVNPPNKGVELLKASLQSKTVLTDVFLAQKAGKKPYM
ncbi:hypothetical protein V6N13_062068 [Hibiscus sabdariffa]